MHPSFGDTRHDFSDDGGRLNSKSAEGFECCIASGNDQFADVMQSNEFRRCAAEQASDFDRRQTWLDG